MITTIRADDLRLVLAAAKLRRHTHGRTCALAAMTAGPVLEADCFSRVPSDGWLQEVRRIGRARLGVTPMHRGHMARLFERVANREGRRGVLATWGVGIRALRQEPRHSLRGGVPA